MKNICHNFYRKIIFNASALPAGVNQSIKAGLLTHPILQRLPR